MKIHEALRPRKALFEPGSHAHPSGWSPGGAPEEGRRACTKRGEGMLSTRNIEMSAHLPFTEY